MPELTLNYADKIDYDAETHSYFVGDYELCSMNQFADSVLLDSFEGVDPYYATRGTDVHTACELVSRLGPDNISPAEAADFAACDSEVYNFMGDAYVEEVEGFVGGWHTFLRESEWENVAREEAIFSKKYDIAGRPDAIGRFPGGPLTVLDIKTGQAYPRYDFCSAGYLVVGNEYYKEELEGRVYVYLKKDSSHRVKFAKRKSDMDAFQNAATFKLWRDKYG